uniref:Uncharacterized protein n=1 Tax=Arundo donax TaxID=35708 RepID=A0A0A9BLV9_ARUDO
MCNCTCMVILEEFYFRSKAISYGNGVFFIFWLWLGPKYISELQCSLATSDYRFKAA